MTADSAGCDLLRPSSRRARSSGTPARRRSASCLYIIASRRVGTRFLRRVSRTSATLIGANDREANSAKIALSFAPASLPVTRCPAGSLAMYAKVAMFLRSSVDVCEISTQDVDEEDQDPREADLFPSSLSYMYRRIIMGWNTDESNSYPQSSHISPSPSCRGGDLLRKQLVGHGLSSRVVRKRSVTMIGTFLIGTTRTVSVSVCRLSLTTWPRWPSP